MFVQQTVVKKSPSFAWSEINKFPGENDETVVSRMVRAATPALETTEGLSKTPCIIHIKKKTNKQISSPNEDHRGCQVLQDEDRGELCGSFGGRRDIHPPHCSGC